MIDRRPALRWVYFMRSRFELNHKRIGSIHIGPAERMRVAARWAESSAWVAHEREIEGSSWPLAALRRAMAHDRAHKSDESPRADARLECKHPIFREATPTVEQIDRVANDLGKMTKAERCKAWAMFRDLPICGYCQCRNCACVP